MPYEMCEMNLNLSETVFSSIATQFILSLHSDANLKQENTALRMSWESVFMSVFHWKYELIIVFFLVICVVISY